MWLGVEWVTKRKANKRISMAEEEGFIRGALWVLNNFEAYPTAYFYDCLLDRQEKARLRREMDHG